MLAISVLVWELVHTFLALSELEIMENLSACFGRLTVTKLRSCLNY